MNKHETIEGTHIVAEYRQKSRFHLGSWYLPAFRSPVTQIAMVGLICFMCPGMFNALTSLGGGGQLDPYAQTNANVALYTTFAVFGFFAGSVNNYIGSKWTIFAGTFGYVLYASSFLSYTYNGNSGFVIASGAILGVCAAMLWCGQGTIMMSYPVESEKGRFIAIFWAIFNMGAVIGSAIAAGLNWASTAGATYGTYVAFIVLMFTGCIIAFCLKSSSKIIRHDGTPVEPPMHMTAWQELRGVWDTIVSEPLIITLFPLFFASNWFYTYQFNDFNGGYFNIRTRAFNSIFYWLSQIFGAGLFGLALDWTRFTRRTRALWCWGVIFSLIMIVWGGGYAFERQTCRDCPVPNQELGDNKGMDVHDSGYGPLIVLYLFYGLMDAMWQTYAYWIMGSLTNDTRRLAYYAGMYKGIQSAGAAVVFRMDAVKLPYSTMFGSSWGLCAASLVCALPLIYIRIRNTEAATLLPRQEAAIEHNNDNTLNEKAVC